MPRSRHLVLALPATALLASPSLSANVTFIGTVANLCVLTLTTPGALGMNSAGAVMSSDDTGGLAATMTVAATGTSPTIAFGAPQLAGPSASATSATKEIEYSSAGGANQGYTSNATTYTMNRLIDSISIKGRVSNAAGFVTGVYTLASTATCQQ